jgi:hypothetical protein
MKPAREGAPGGAVKASESEMPAAPQIVEARHLIAEMIDRVEIAIEDSSPAVKRLVALKIISFEAKFFSVHSDRDILPLKLSISELEQALATFSDDRRDGVGDSSSPYSIEGIAFSAFIHLVRIENATLGRGCTAEDLRALGLDVQRDEELTWLDAEHAEISDWNGTVRYRYRRQ